MSKTKDLTEISISVALAIICRFIKIWEMPQGGAVSFTMVPIIFIAIKRGAFSGTLTGAIYGFLSAIFHGTIFHPMSIFLDYIFAFSVLGIAGLFGKHTCGIIFGCIFAVMARFIFSYISGITIFADFVPIGQNIYLYSFLYQSAYLFPQLIIVIVIMLTIHNKFPMMLKL